MERALKGRLQSRLDRVVKWPWRKGTTRLDLLSDEELVERARAGDEEAFQRLVVRYRPLFESRLKRFYLAGAEAEDLLQEALIGFFKAVRDFDKEKAHSFRYFAELCVTRQVTSAVRTATRHKHKPLNTSLPIDQPLDEGGEEQVTLEEVAAGQVADPDEHVFVKQVYDELRKHMESELSDLERKVLFHHLEGKSYQEIARDLNCGVKCVDNALQRARKKLNRWAKAFLG